MQGQAHGLVGGEEGRLVRCVEVPSLTLAWPPPPRMARPAGRELPVEEVSYWTVAVSRSAGAETWISPELARKVAADSP